MAKHPVVGFLLFGALGGAAALWTRNNHKMNDAIADMANASIKEKYDKWSFEKRVNDAAKHGA